MLSQWQFGYAAIIGGIIIPVFYLIVRQIKRFAAWANREEGPKERVTVYIVICSIMGVFIGGLSQGFVDIGVSCYKQDRPLIGCVIENSFRSGKK